VVKYNWPPEKASSRPQVSVLVEARKAGWKVVVSYVWICSRRPA
jgi:hypothetical protein